ncbi:MAG TPA: response regulator transcription factor [Vicinamibacterales bacterium]|jgi:DNA-binding NarL/FixJ family response regulator|nr:response regulator transcription factor [Vicinamibacterales bacterium]
MRVVIVGSARERALVRADLEAAGLEVAGEFASLDEARAADVSYDAVVLPRSEPGVRRVEGLDEDFEPVETLTAREREVLELLAEGLPNKAIAARLKISDQTVKFHVASICGKLDATNRTDAVSRAIRLGLITL